MLTDEQEEQIKSFMAVGDIASAQAIIMKELAVEIGGVAEAAGETSSGKMEQFKNQLDDMKETIGAALVPVLLRFMEAITPLIEKFAAASPQMQNFIMVLAGILAAAGPVISVIGGLVSGIGAIAPVVAAIGAALSPLLIPILAIIAVVALLYAAWKTNFFGIRDTAITVWEAMKLVFQAFKAAFSGDWRQFGELLRQAWDLIWALIEQRISNAWNTIKQAAMNIVNGVRQAFTIDWGELGRRIIDGIVNGLRNGIATVVQMARNVAQAAANAVRGFLGIKSPSQLMYNYGQMTAQGFANGMQAGGKMNIPATLGMNAGRIAAPVSGGNAGSNITINIENPKKETAEESIRRALKSLSYTGAIPA
jgi:phage-related minor tail protein